MIRFGFLLAGLALCAGLVSCGHYRLGTESARNFQTLHVELVKSEALVPQAVALVSTQVREAFIKDGRVKLVNSAAEADATLVLTLEALRRDIAVVRPDDTGLARRFDVTLQARAELRDNRAGTLVFASRPLLARRGVFADSGQIQAEYQTLPLLAEKLADEALRAVLDVW